MKLENLQDQVVACKFKGHNAPFRRPSLSLSSPTMAIQQSLVDQIFTSYTCRLSSLEQLIHARYLLKHAHNYEFTSEHPKSAPNKTQDYLQLVSESSKRANDCVKKEKDIVKLFCSVQADHLIMRQIAVNLCNKVVEINSKLYQAMLSLGAKIEAADFLEKYQSLKIQLSGTLQMNGEQSFSAIMSLIIFSREVLHQEIIMCNQQYSFDNNIAKKNNNFSTQSLHYVSQQPPSPFPPQLKSPSTMGSLELPFKLLDDYLQPININNLKNEQQSSQLAKYNNCIVGAMTQILPQKTRKNSKNKELSSYAQQQIHYKCIEISHRNIYTPTKKHKTSLETASSMIISNKESIRINDLPQQQRQKEDLILKQSSKERPEDVSNRDKRSITIGQASVQSLQSTSSHNQSSESQKYFPQNQQNSQMKSICDKEKDRKNDILVEKSYSLNQQYFNQQCSQILEENVNNILALTAFKSLETINEKKVYLEKMYSSMLKANNRCSQTIKAYLAGAMLAGKMECQKREKTTEEQPEQIPSNLAIFHLSKLKSKLEIQNKVNLQKDLFQFQVQAKVLKKSRTVRTFKLPKEICVSKQSSYNTQNPQTEVTETLQAVKVPGEPFSKLSGETSLFSSSPKRSILSSSSADKRDIQQKIDEKTPQFRIVKPNSLTFKILTSSSPQVSKGNSRSRFSSPTSEKQQQQQQHPQLKQFQTKKLLKDDKFGKMLFLDEQINYDTDKTNPQSQASNTEKRSTKKQYQQQYQSTTPRTLASPNMISVMDRKETFIRPISTATSLLARCSSDQNYQFNTKTNYYALNQAKIYFPLISQMRTDIKKNDNPFQDATLLKCQTPSSSCKSPLIFPK